MRKAKTPEEIGLIQKAHERENEAAKEWKKKKKAQKKAQKKQVEKNKQRKLHDLHLKKQLKIQELNEMPYREYLQTEHWKKLRYRIRKRANQTCKHCLTRTAYTDVHHTTYANRGNPTKEIHDLILLCQDCHRKEHNIK